MSKRASTIATSIVLTWNAIVTTAIAAVTTLALVLTPIGMGRRAFPRLFGVLLERIGRLRDAHEQLTGIAIPEVTPAGVNSLLTTSGKTLGRLRTPGTWRILAWGTIGVPISGVFAFAPVGLLGWGLEVIVVRPFLTIILGVDPNGLLGLIPMPDGLNLAIGAGIGLGLVLAGLLPARRWFWVSSIVLISVLRPAPLAYVQESHQSTVTSAPPSARSQT